MTALAVIESKLMLTISKLWRVGTPIARIALELDISEDDVEAYAKRMGLAPKPTATVPEITSTLRPARTTAPARKRRRRSSRHVDNKAFQADWESSVPIRAMAETFAMAPGSVSKHARALGLEPRRRGKKPGQRPSDSSQRRFTSVRPSDQKKAPTRPTTFHPAIRDGATIYGRSVTPASEMKRLLISGHSNPKIGAMSVKGRWKGMPIYTLTLEERATCPRTCEVWVECYGNNMGQAKRIADDGSLMPLLLRELVLLSIEHPQGFIVRLHVLGDFYSEEYVRFWSTALDLIPELHIFGFTARRPETAIGQALVHMMNDHLDQVAMRWSGIDSDLHGSEVIPRGTAEPLKAARGIVCPNELDSSRYCANCGLCWNSERTISFLEH